MMKPITILDVGYLVRDSIPDRIFSLLGASSKRGPNIVVQSLLGGMDELAVKYNYNPKKVSEIHDTVLVLGYVETLKVAIELKKSGQIKRLLAGPNLVVYSTDSDSILSSKMIDTVVVPSEQIKSRYLKDLPALKDRIEIWPTGIDIKYWMPKNTRDNKSVLVYVKTDNTNILKLVRNFLDKNNISYNTLVYGKYSQRKYLDVLSKSSCAIFLSESESQGIALLESWSMDVPTFAWNPGKVLYEGKIINHTSSCPYISSMTGEPWSHISDFNNSFMKFYNNLSKYNARWWVVNNMTIQHSCIKIVKLAKLDN